MALRRHFLGWDRPLVHSVTDFIIPAPPTAPVDLEQDLVIVPTRQAGRRLTDALARACSDHGTALLSCRPVTPPALLRPDPPPPDLATGLDIRWAWLEALRDADLSRLPALFPVPPADTGTDWALRMAGAIHTLRRTLVDAGLSLTALVRTRADTLAELDRWADLARLEERYLEALRAIGRRDPCVARIAQADHPVLHEGVTRLIVAAVPDPAPLFTHALDSLAGRVTIDILVAAPAALADTFDPYGRPVPDHWCECDLDIPHAAERLVLAAGPAGQAEQAARRLEAMGDAVALGAPDRGVIPYLARALDARGVASFDPADVPLAAFPVHGLVKQVAGLVTERSYAAAARLLRHPDVLAWLAHDHALSAVDLLTELDTFQNARLPVDVDRMLTWLKGPDVAEYPVLARAMSAIEDALPRPGDALAPALRDLLQAVYRHRVLRSGTPHDDAFARAARAIDEGLRELEQRETQHRLPAAASARLLLHRLDDVALPHDRPPGALDLDGWLELPWNAAPHLVLTGMNENAVPGGRVDDPFLPDTLRSQLGLRDDRARLARDSFLFRSMLGARAGGQVWLIAGKISDAGDPLRPSRLLMRCPDPELPARAAALFRNVPDARPTPPASVSFALDPAAPPREERGVPATIHVTALRDYLACPFRFYLRRVLNMETLDDAKRAPDALDFGILIHDALQRMAENPALRSCTDVARLSDFLQTRAEQWVHDRFGEDPALPVTMALDAACQRLEAAARVHAEQVENGWDIVAAENGFDTVLGGMTLRGKIDRVDRHRDTGALRLIDYKTGDTPASPAAAHLAAARDDDPPFARVTHGGRHARWVDLQLPLYVLFGGYPDARPAYFNLPRAVSDTALATWDDFDDALAASARSCAEGIAQAIRRGAFWPPSERVPFDDFEHLFRGGTASFSPMADPRPAATPGENAS